MGANVFNVYSLGDKGPLLVLLHGGGYNGLTWALFAVSGAVSRKIVLFLFFGSLFLVNIANFFISERNSFHGRMSDTRHRYARPW